MSSELIKSVYFIFPDLSKDGYDWKGWYTLPNGNGVKTTSLPADLTARGGVVPWIFQR